MKKIMSRHCGIQPLAGKKTILFLLAFCLFLPGLALADGGLIPPPDTYMYETGQRAAIFYESDTQTETLVVSMMYEGNAKDFAWLVPTPNKPDVSQGSQDLFTSLQEITQDYYDYGYPETYGLGAAEADTAEQKVTVVEEKTVDYYDVAVLSSTDANALSKWLNDNGFQYPEKYSYLFNEYINNGWFFVAAKIIPELAGDTSVESDLNTGTATPIQLTFTAENMVYPMKISQIAIDNTKKEGTDNNTELIFGDAPSYMDVTLYIIADKKKELTGFTTNYADSITGKEVQNLAYNTQGDPWVEPDNNNYYLTELYQYYAVADMNQDLFPQDAEDDSNVTSGYSWSSDDTWTLVMYSILFSIIGLILVILTPFFLFYVIYALIFFFAKNKKVKITFFVIQILDTVSTWLFLAGAIVVTVFAFISMFDNIGYYYYSLEEDITLTAASLGTCVSFLAIGLVKIVGLIIEARKLKKTK